MVLPAMVISGIAIMRMAALGVGRAFPRYHGGTDVSAIHGRESCDGITVSPACTLSPSGRDTPTVILVVTPKDVAVREIVFAPIPENSGRGLPSTVHWNSARSLSNVGVDAVTVNSWRGEGEDGEEERDIGGGITWACAAGDSMSPMNRNSMRNMFVRAIFF